MIVQRVWWRRITNNDLYNIEKPLPPGPKGQLHIDIPRVPQLLSFFGYSGSNDPSTWPPFGIDAKCLKDPSVSSHLTFRPRPKNSRYDIPQQNINAEGSERHPAWTSAFGWPPVHGLLNSSEEASRVLSESELRILILEDSLGDYYADFVLGSQLPSYMPKELNGIFDGESAGSLEFSITEAVPEVIEGNRAPAPLSAAEPLPQNQSTGKEPDISGTNSRGKIRHSSVGSVDSEASVSRRQGYGLNAPEKRAVETRAISVAIEHFANLGFSDIRDVGSHASYDLTMLRDGQVHFVEVKGTTGLGGVILLTRNEVQVHKTYFPFNALAVVSNIKLHRGEVPSASGGDLRVIRPWEVKDADLSPLTFEYNLPPG